MKTKMILLATAFVIFSMSYASGDVNQLNTPSDVNFKIKNPVSNQSGNNQGKQTRKKDGTGGGQKKGKGQGTGTGCQK